MVIMEYRSSLQLVAMFFGVLCFGSVGYIMGGSLPNVQCIESEQEALLRFKEGLVDHSDRLPSWNVVEEADCCKWRGVKCNHTTGHVMAIDLHTQRTNESLQGELNHLGNLSRLHSLNLSGGYHSLRANNLDWLQGLSSLKILDLGGVDLSNAVNWLNEINMLPSLVELHLFACNLNKLPSTLPHVNFTTLEILDLSLNNFNSPIPRWLFNLSHSLVYLNLTRNQLRGAIPDSFGNMTSLTVLDLSDNNLKGGVPTSLGLIPEGEQLKGASSLRELHLSKNQLEGTLAQSLGLLSTLVVLDVAENRLAGVINEAHFLNLSSLRVLDMSSNSFVLNMSSSWIPTFQLDIIRLRSCHLGPLFPKWLRTQKSFLHIDLSNANILDTMPNWFWNLSTVVEHLDVSSNQLEGKVPNLSLKLNLSHLDLSDNTFDGPLPSFSAKMVSLVLAQNLFSGPISRICESLVTKSSLETLDLYNNNLSGKLPDCWVNGQSLFFLDLADNQLYGKIPDSIGSLPLMALSLRGNSLYGELPLSLKNCTTLVLMVLSDNMLSGSIPSWVGESLPSLSYLLLRSNNFSGSIPLQLCQLRFLKILDLSENYISGEIPRCIKNNRGMAVTEYDPYTGQGEDMLRLFKRRSFLQNLEILCSIDLSSNKLSGAIPKEVTSLVGLSALNLSNNHLTGAIPRDIGAMKMIEALDLSRNKLSCSIPTSITELNFLAVLDVSHNNLSGRIPVSTQLQSFDGTSYLGNPNLCGPPLANSCLLSNETYEDAFCRSEEGSQDDNDDGLETTSFYISMAVGFVTSYCGFWSALLFSNLWRHAYYRFLDNLCDKIYVMVAVNVNILRRKFQSKHA